MIKSEEKTTQRIFIGDQRMYGMFIGDFPIFLTYLKVSPKYFSMRRDGSLEDVNVKSNTEWYI